MFNRSIAIPLLMMIGLFVAVPGISQGASIKDRMAARIPVINNLKAAGVVGENNKGLLEFRSGDKSKQDVVTAENNDRKKVYAAIAKKEGVNPTLVGQRRAQMIAQKGKKGQWFQGADGKWYKK
ncbi:YdbL family protein [Desulfopila sp. IMCC35008]|uniref:YdbL family protein n=1 Tax=Desulfopila sp. IMCC35008 TaxID=2653858 RepID=UPI0013D5972E|nr:YdbL family protein [Desulfopila sp. IMCC35008]